MDGPRGRLARARPPSPPPDPPPGGALLRILGIDPGSRATGYGVVHRSGREVRHVAHGTLRPPRSGSLALRLCALQQALREVIERHAPDVACVEQVFVAASPRSALVLGQARGAALAALGEAGVGLVEYTPSRIKQAVTGSGSAPKAQVQRMVRRWLGLESAPDADAADALAAALCCAQAGPLEALGAAPGRRRRPTRRGWPGAVRRAR